MGVPIRCCARVVGSSDTQKLDNGSIFIAGNAMELVPAGKSDGEKHTFSRIFDEHASDKDVYESEVLPLLGSLVSGSNVSLIMTGSHRGGHGHLFSVLAPLCVDAIFDLMQQRQASIGGNSNDLTFQLSARYASVVLGSDHMSDLLSSGSSELRIVRDAEALGGVQMPGLSTQAISQPSVFGDLLRTGRTRLVQQHKPPAPSSVLYLELQQTVRAEGRRNAPPEVLLSQLLLADVEVGVLGDGLSNALRQTLQAPPTQLPAHSGAALLLREAVGGNGRTLLVGCVQPSDYDESAATLQLLTHGMQASTFPLVNDATSRGLLRRHYWHMQQLQESLAVAEQRLNRGVEQLAQDRQQLPSQLFSATERLQGIMDEMQQDASGHAGQRQDLMAELMQQRTKANQATGELVTLKEELLHEKQEKMALGKELLGLQLGANESSARTAQRVFELEQQALASADVLSQLEKRGEEQAELLAAQTRAREGAERDSARLQRQQLVLQAQLQSAHAAADEGREREDERNMQLLNATSARAAAEKRAAELEAAAAETAAELERARARAERDGAALEAARGSAEEARAAGGEARLATERAQLQAEQDVLAVQKQATRAAEQAAERVRALQAELLAGREEARLAAAAAAARDKARDAELERTAEQSAALRAALSAHEEQLSALQSHCEALSGEPPHGEAGAAAAAGGAPPPSAAEELHAYQRQVNGVLQANRALTEAYWQLRGLVAAGAGAEGAPLPSHEELQLAALVQPATGRREVPSELEKALGRARGLENGGRPLSDDRLPFDALGDLEAREKAQLERQLQRAKAAADAQLGELASTYEGQGAGRMELEKERAELRAELGAAAQREAELRARAAELERDAAAARSVAALKETQGELIEELNKLRDEGEAEQGRPSAELQRENERLQAQLEQLTLQLASQAAGGGASAPQLTLQMQVRELVASQGALERERSALVQRSTSAEEQLSEIQKYLATNIARYQKEIVRLRDELARQSS